LLGIEQGVASMMECLCPFAGLVSVCWKLLSWICWKLRSAINVVGSGGGHFHYSTRRGVHQ
jgi:hypothetical protein